MVRAFIRVALSLFCAGAFYIGWLAAFLLTTRADSSAAHTIRWLSAPVVTAAGFAVGIAISERFTNMRKVGFFCIFLWPLAGCAIGAGAVYWFGPMLIVFGMFTVGTASVIIREVVLHVAAIKGTASYHIENGDRVRPASCWYEGLPQTGTAVCPVWTR